MSDDTRDIILLAAEREFADKGFDGARVDQIAKSAGVNKALIYYYFKSKKNLLTALYEKLVNDTMDRMESGEINIETVNPDRDNYHRFFHEFIQFLNRYKLIIRILYMESLKGNKETSLLSLIEMYMSKRTEKLVTMLSETGMHFEEDKNQWLMTEFFTGILPIVNYILFKDDLMEQMSLGSEDLDHYFMTSMAETHLKTHK